MNIYDLNRSEKKNSFYQNETLKLTIVQLENEQNKTDEN